VLLGAGAAAAAGLTVGLAGPAFAGTAVAGAAGGVGKATGEAPFGPVNVDGSSASYARAVRLSTSAPGKSRTLLATYQSFGSSFPVLRSDDDGRTWTKQSSINIGSVALQPFLYELPRAFAGLPKGALLFACNSFGKFDGTYIQLYSSTDAGVTWEFVSTVAQGGPPNTTNGATPVWEPFLLLHNDKLICYYSDQRDPKYGQKLAHQTSTDLHNWGPVVDDATGTVYPERPGMTSVARLRGDLWIMTYEFGTPDDPTNPNPNYTGYPVHYRLAKDPEEFRFSEDTPLVTPDGVAPNASPMVSWADTGDANGVIIVTANDDKPFFVNRDLGDPSKWSQLDSPMPAGYSRQTIPLDGPGAPQNRGLVFVIAGAQYGESTPVQSGIVSVNG
jgi:hypothetical protein